QDPESRPTAIEFSVQEDLAAIIYTSGTTGFPKGAMLTHHNLVTNTFSARDAIGFLPGEDRMLVVLPLFHSFAATIGMLSTLLHGGSFIPLPRFEPEAVAGAIATHKATIFLGVPSMYNLLLRLPDSLTAKLSSLRLCASGGAALPVEIMRRFEARFDCPIYEGDGPTECSPLTCLNPIDGERKPGSVGLPVPQVEMRILDEQGTELPDGEVGEICVRGPNVMKGYWKLPEETRASFFDDWFRTGDLGYRDEDGYFFMVDRKKDMIIVNGMNVYPRMIEEVLYCIPEIAEAAVVGEPSPLHGEIPVAYVALKKPDDASSSQIRAYCREHLGRHEVPRKIFFMPELPKNATGKILKRELRKHGELERGVDSREPEISK
ncbi:MAG: long-chain fatty acid--CoA ligase, partial [Gammaproteobacteria bacterium]|nr:long-chain fatty acid--CoA ligase [Gammaproteobacteria bacterium]